MLSILRRQGTPMRAHLPRVTPSRIRAVRVGCLFLFNHALPYFFTRISSEFHRNVTIISPEFQQNSPDSHWNFTILSAEFRQSIRSARSQRSLDGPADLSRAPHASFPKAPAARLSCHLRAARGASASSERSAAQVSTEVTFGRGDLSVCPIRVFTRAHGCLVSDWRGVPFRPEALQPRGWSPSHARRRALCLHE